VLAGTRRAITSQTAEEEVSCESMTFTTAASTVIKAAVGLTVASIQVENSQCDDEHPPLRIYTSETLLFRISSSQQNILLEEASHLTPHTFRIIDLDTAYTTGTSPKVDHYYMRARGPR
jgi:hypothetical protein